MIFNNPIETSLRHQSLAFYFYSNYYIPKQLPQESNRQTFLHRWQTIFVQVPIYFDTGTEGFNFAIVLDLDDETLWVSGGKLSPKKAKSY